MKIINKIKYLTLIFCSLLVSCEDFVAVDTPNNRIVKTSVFVDETTAQSAMQGIYNQLYRLDFSRGFENSVTNLTALSADNLQLIRDNNPTYLEFLENEILPGNARNLSLWSSAYNMIYMTNALLEGLEGSLLEEGFKNSLEGQARFIRAFTYFNLVNLYGDVPLLLSTDYRYNATAPRVPLEDVYDQILEDLEVSSTLLMENYPDSERTVVNKFVAFSLMARLYLYLENWEQAEYFSSQVIHQQNTYQLLEDLDLVFLQNSKEAIWQISPLGKGGISTETNEGALYVIEPGTTALYNLKLTQDLVNTFQVVDQRLVHWVGYSDIESVYFAHKYKDRNSTNNLTEYSMVLRLAEQYLIRSEARAMQNKIDSALQDINSIRTRAGLESLNLNQNWNSESLRNLILEERRKEFFMEWGHRWFDLKRTGLAEDRLSVKKPGWQNTDVYYPIPDEERIMNTNLTQNDGY
ncbi:MULTISPECIES: RagB/SusD family nutrient uptake outer membrane protein [Flavobacteriaceae]|uniref:RagB/SusD family nutrient uptake outer membrane protein n=1 Tax=Flavobacteriaceae TaxID=49546 RepID=UPI000C8B6440|nr:MULTISPECIES: RagB/SusD family nutrient uptake outer membrane protein [Flavobacteriaceae]MAG88330.1 RagB/SusD family nutrient uptake outer membrane protein [Flavobacteriaceae bacterium]MAN25726.1 RagB/SusD family nutrient uptake outer membrane protein [Mesonia sp.]MAN25742.1 RagB/SusD family nutrient uptake outer membrane protein [Mesonia sp.]|tara:strand:+ start:2635 stop:4029 length:1395 start_codon:yes stop_codon:yes gene_type:complete